MPLLALKSPYKFLGPLLLSPCSFISNIFPVHSICRCWSRIIVGWSFLEDGSIVLIRNFGVPCTTTHKSAIWVQLLALICVVTNTASCNALQSERMMYDAKIHNSRTAGLQNAIYIAFVDLLLPYPRVCVHKIYSIITLSCTVPFEAERWVLCSTCVNIHNCALLHTLYLGFSCDS